MAPSMAVRTSSSTSIGALHTTLSPESAGWPLVRAWFFCDRERRRVTLKRSTWMWALVALGGLGLTACTEKANVEAKAPAAPADADGDGVPDDKDKCVGEKEDGKPPDPNDGCKSKDSDGDGIDDSVDKCIGQK